MNISCALTSFLKKTTFFKSQPFLNMAIILATDFGTVKTYFKLLRTNATKTLFMDGLNYLKARVTSRRQFTFYH